MMIGITPIGGIHCFYAKLRRYFVYVIIFDKNYTGRAELSSMFGPEYVSRTNVIGA